MKTTSQLSQDHQVILRGIEILKAAAASWDKGLSGAAEDCGALLDFLKTFVDRCHHGKEEHVLFPSLIEAGIPVEGGPLGVMMFEHDQGRQLIRGMEKAFERQDPADFAMYARGYAQLLADHIMKEDHILFVRADDILTRDQDDELFRRFEEIDREIGEDAHKRFDQMLDSLGSRYFSGSTQA